MFYFKKSLGQNFLIDKNIVKKIINLTKVENQNILEIGAGKGALTVEILKKKPKSLIIIEKDFNLAKELKEKYKNYKKVKIINMDILKLDIEKKIKKNTIIFGNLPYNISSQILIKFIKFNNWPPLYTNIIFMFQKELGEKITSNFPSTKYGRISIIRNYRLKILRKFLVSPNCFFPKPKVNSMVIHFKPSIKYLLKIRNLENLEKITNLIFSSKRKMINKSLKKILTEDMIPKNWSLKKRPSDISPEIFYEITSLYENK